MIDRDTCMACSKHRHRVDNERIEYLEDIYRENMDNPEDIKVESYEGQFSELHRKASIQEENDELKAEIHRLKALARSNKFFTEKRHEDLMKYQDKQNEEIEKLNRAVKQLKKIQTDYVETVIRIENLRIAEEFENTKLKERNKTLRKKARQALDKLDLYKKRHIADVNLIEALEKENMRAGINFYDAQHSRVNVSTGVNEGTGEKYIEVKRNFDKICMTFDRFIELTLGGVK